MTGQYARTLKDLGIPNWLSVLRLFLIPVFVIVFFLPSTLSGFIAAGILVFSGLTDIADGIIARKFNMTTALGKILDPLADKLTQATVCVCLFFRGIAPWLLLLFILKEAVMIVAGANVIRRGREIGSSKWFGKLSTVVFYIVMILIIALRPDSRMATILIVISLCFMLFSLCMYIPIFLKLVSGREK